MGISEIAFGALSLLVVVGFWITVVVIIARSIRRNNGTSSLNSGLQILEERYARGEITEHEFLERRAVLRGTS